MNAETRIEITALTDAHIFAGMSLVEILDKLNKRFVVDAEVAAMVQELFAAAPATAPNPSNRAEPAHINNDSIPEEVMESTIVEQPIVPKPVAEVPPAVTDSEPYPDVAPKFPLELKKLNRWIVRTADKHPYSAWQEDENLGPIDPHDPQYQSDYDNAMGALDQTTKFSGAGFVFNYADGLTGTDFDKCVDPVTREIRADVFEIIKKADSYCEFSPSGEGIHIFTKGWQFPIDPAEQSDPKRREGSKVGKAEIYSGKRYFTVTGNHVPGTPLTVNESDLGWLHKRIVIDREFFEAKKNADGTTSTAEFSCVSTMKAPGLLADKYNTLMNGVILRSKDTTGSSDFAIEDGAQILEYESQSAADYALLRLIADKLNTDDPNAIEQEFLNSPLGQRPKAKRGDYLQRSIAKLLKEPRRPFIVQPVVDDSGEHTGVSIDRPKLLTEVGNGRRLIETYGKNIRYCPEDGLWLFFNGKVWQVDRRGTHVDDLMKRVLMAMHAEATNHIAGVAPELLDKLHQKKMSVEVEETNSKGKTVKKNKTVDIVLTPAEKIAAANYGTAHSYKEWAESSESNQRISGATEQAKSEPGVSIAKSAFDVNKFVCNVENGSFVFAPETAEVTFRKHLRGDYCTKMMPVVYIPGATCPEFQKFLTWMFPDPGVRKYLQTYFGLCLTGIVVRKILILYGEGANGKSTLVRVLHHMFGEALDAASNKIAQPYGLSSAFATFSVGRDETAGGTRADLLPLKGARFVTAAESNKKKGRKGGVTLDMARIKELTGGDVTTARGLYQTEETKFTSQAKILLQTNNLPQIDDDSDGAWERLKLINCQAKVEEKDQDEQLPEKLMQEASGILNWLLEGVAMYFREGFNEPISITTATEEFRGAENHIGRFASEVLETAGDSIKTPSTEIYRRYKEWCQTNGEDAESQRALTQYLQRRLKIASKHARDGDVLCGIRLKTRGGNLELTQNVSFAPPVEDVA